MNEGRLDFSYLVIIAMLSSQIDNFKFKNVQRVVGPFFIVNIRAFLSGLY